MSVYPLLSLCARINGHEEQYQKIRSAAEGFEEWEILLQSAELHGMIPLLNLHLKNSGCEIPSPVRRSLSIAAKHHTLHAERLRNVLESVIRLFSSKQLTPVVLKGGVLAHTLYPAPGTRPMRDLDVLLSPEEAPVAQSLLRENGYEPSTDPVPEDHFHLRPLFTEVNGHKICIEIHRGLYPDCPPYYEKTDFEHLLKNSQPFTINTVTALSMGNEDLLSHVYEHGFHAPLTYEPYKLINAADLIGLTESLYSEIDWEKMSDKYPRLCRVLPYLTHIAPWDPDLIAADFIAKAGKKKNVSTKPFHGWPARKIKQQQAESRKFHQIVISTFFPPLWWLKMYYGLNSLWGICTSLLAKHPLQIFWWMKIYFSLLSENQEQHPQNGEPAPDTTGKMAILYRKFKGL